MLEGLVAWVLNNYLGKYVENLNTDQLSIALLSGEVELENLPLKKDALRHIGLPIEIRAGFIGKVKLQIPVRQIRSAPWVIVIEQLYVVASPLPLQEWDSAAEESAAHEFKLNALDMLEAKWRVDTDTKENASTYYASSYSSWLNYGTGFITDIVENLQLKIRDVNVRYEDSVCIPGKTVACGVTVESLSAQSCDSTWAPGFTHWDSSEASYKVLELHKLSIYWDTLNLTQQFSHLSLGDLAVAMAPNSNTNHNYILAPVSSHAHVKRNRSELPLRESKNPRIVCDLQLEEVPISLIDWQYDQIVKCLHGLDDITRLRRYRRWRPPCLINQDARAWWLYAITCYSYPKQPSFCLPQPTWESCSLRAKQNVKYVALYVQILTTPTITLGSEDKTLKDTVEWSRDYEDLRVLREIAMRKVPCPQTGSDPNYPKGRSMLVRWFPQWWGWYSTTNITSNTATDSNPLEAKILEALEDPVENNTILKRDVVFGQFNFALKSGSINLCTSDENSPADANVSMIELQFENLKLNIESRPRTASHSIELILGALYLRDKLTIGTLFPVLIGPPGPERIGPRSRSRTQLPKISSKVAENAEPFFQLCYDLKPLNSNCEYKLQIKSQSLDVVYQPNAVRWLAEFLCRPYQRSITHTRIEAMKNRTKIELMKNWENILDGRLHERKSWELQLDISAPQIIFVEQFCDPNSAIAVVDFGHLQLSNTVPEQGLVIAVQQPVLGTKESEDDEMFMTPCSTPPGSEASESDTIATEISNRNNARIQSDALNEQSFHHKLYDRYCVELNDLQILVGRVKDNWRFAHTKGTSTLHVLDRFNISLHIERRMVHTCDPLYPSLTLSANLPRLVAHINEHKINAARKLSQIISATSLPSPFNAPESSISDGMKFNDEESISLDTSVEMSRLFMLQFTIDHMALEVQSRGRSIAELQVSGVRTAFTKRPCDITMSLTVHSLLLVDALQTFGPDFELLVASHKHVGMDSLSGSLRDSEPTSPTSPGSPDPNIRVSATSPVALTQALSTLASSPPPPSLWGVNNQLKAVTILDAEALISIEVVLVEGTEPMHIATIQFNNLDIIANQETIVELVGFVQRVFPHLKPTVKHPRLNVERPVSQTTDSVDAGVPPPKPNICRTELTFDFHRLNVLLLRGIVKDGCVYGKKIATATLSEAKIQATVDNSLVVEGSLGGLQVVDLTPEGHMHQRIISVGRDPLMGTIHPMYTMSQAMYFESERRAFSFNVTRPFKGTNAEQSSIAEINIRMASVWYTHSPQFLSELQSCATEFKQYLTNLARSISSAATDMALGLVHARAEALAQSLYINSRLSSSIYGSAMSLTDLNSPRRRRRSSSRDDLDTYSGYSSVRDTTPHTPYSPEDDADFIIDIQLDIILDSPVLVIPRTSNSPEVFVAHLGKISINNAKTQPHAQDQWDNFSSRIERYGIEIRDMNLFSLDTSSRRVPGPLMNKAENLYCCKSLAKPILHDTVLQLNIEREIPVNVASRQDSLSNILLDDDLNFADASQSKEWPSSENVQISGNVVTALKVSLTRGQFEQVLDTWQWLTGSHLDVTPQLTSRTSSRPPALADISEEGIGVSTLSMDPHVRAKLFPSVSIGKGNVKPKNDAKIKVLFELPIFTIELRGESVNGEQGLVDLSFREFIFSYEKCHRYETNIQVSLRSILMEDLLKPEDSKQRAMVVSSSGGDIPQGSGVSRSCPDITGHFPSDTPFHGSLPNHLVIGRNVSMDVSDLYNGYKTEYPCTPPPSPTNKQRPERNLVIISTLLVDPAAPNFKSHYNSAQRCTSVDFNCLDLVVSVESWVVVIDFFSASPTEPTKKYPQNVSQQINDAEQLQDKTNIENTETTVFIRSLTVVIAKPDYDVARANLSNVDLCIKTHGLQKEVQGLFGSMSLLDLTLQGQLYRERFLTTGRQALKFNYIRYPPKEKPEYDAQLKIEMSSVLYVHTKRFVAEIQSFFNHFSQLQAVMASIRAATSGQKMTDEPRRLSLILHANAPIILVPVSSKSSQLLVADLGNLVLTNSFRFAGSPDTVSVLIDGCSEKQCLLDVMLIELSNMDLYGGVRAQDCSSPAGIRQSNHDYFRLGSCIVSKEGQSLLTEKCHLRLQVERNLDSISCHNVADLSIHGELSTLEASLDLEQYKLIKGLLTYNLGENTEHILPSVNPQFTTDVFLRNVWTLSSMRFDLLNVTVRLRITKSSLACINFIKSRLLIETFSNLTQDIDLVSQEILIIDTRFEDAPVNKRSNVFTNILQPINCTTDSGELVQAEIHSRKRQDRTKFTILLNNMRLMAILDWWEAARNFIFVEDTYAESVQASTMQNVASNSDDKVAFELKLNITDSEVVIVEDTSQWDTNAVILKSTTVISFRPNITEKPLSCNLNNCEMYSCILGMEDETALSIIDPVTLNLDINMENVLEVQLQHLSVRLSYHDLRMFMQIINSLPKQTLGAKSPSPSQPANVQNQISKLAALGFAENDCVKALETCEQKLDDAALWLTQNAVPEKTYNASGVEVEEKRSQLQISAVEVKAECISVCIIDDCADADVPLLELTLSLLYLKRRIGDVSQIEGLQPDLQEGTLECVLASDYYNRVLSGWEPVIEPWKCTINWDHSLSADLTRNRFQACVTSNDLLNINITSTFVDLYQQVRESWMQDFYNDGVKDQQIVKPTGSPYGYRRRSPFVPFAIKNDTGSPLHFTTLITDMNSSFESDEFLEQNDNWTIVVPGETTPFSFKTRDKLRHQDSHKLKIHQLGMKVEGWKPVTPVSVDKVGVYFRHTAADLPFNRNQYEIPQTRIVFDVELQGSAKKLVTVRSALLIANKLPQSIEIKLEGQVSPDAVLVAMWPASKTLIVASNCTLAVPLMHTHSQICVRPIDSQQIYTYCSPYLSWNSPNRSGEGNNYEQRACHTPRGHVYRFCAEIKRENYPTDKTSPAGVHLHPAHTITILPPLLLVNLLPLDLMYISGSQCKGRITPGAEAAITDVDTEKVIELHLYLEYFPSCSPLIIASGTNSTFKCRLRLQDHTGRRLFLQAVIAPFTDARLKIIVSAPFWIINRTGLPLVFRQEGVSSETAGQFEEHELARMVAPLLFSFSDPEASPTVVARVGTAVIQTGTAQWCQHFHLHRGVQVRRLRVSPRDGRPDVVFVIGIEVRTGRGQYHSTNIVTISPRFQLHNKSSYELLFVQSCYATTMTDPGTQLTYLRAVPDCFMPFHWPRLDKDQLLCVKIQDIPDCCWSGGLKIDTNYSMHVNVRDVHGRMYFLRLEVVLQGATFFIVFTDADTMPPPIRVDNFSEVAVNFAQACCKDTNRSTARAHSSVPYAWDEPTKAQNLTIIAPGGISGTYDMNILGAAAGLTYENFIYIAFTGTFKSNDPLDPLDVESQQLVLDVIDGYHVVLSRKQSGERSQLWRMTSQGQLQHEGSSPPSLPQQPRSDKILVLDIEGPAPQPSSYIRLMLKRPDPRRQSTQTWRFTEEGRLCCAHYNMCVQAQDGFFGLRLGNSAVLGLPQPICHRTTESGLPLEQAVSRQRLRPGSGFLSVEITTDGPTKVLSIHDIKERKKYAMPDERDWSSISEKQRPHLVPDMDVDSINTFWKEIQLTVKLAGLGVSLVARRPPEELLYMKFSTIIAELIVTKSARCFCVSVENIQCDNQLIETPSTVVLYLTRSRSADEALMRLPAIQLTAEIQPTLNENAVIFKHFIITIKPVAVHLEERLLLKLFAFIGSGGGDEEQYNVDESDFETQRMLTEVSATHSKRYYFGIIKLVPSQIRLSMKTVSKLPVELQAIKRKLGLTLIKFEDAAVDLEPFIREHPFETSQFLMHSIVKHFKDELLWQAGIILGSVDFLGNPLGFVNDVSEGVSGLIYEGSVGALVKNVTHGISNSAAKVTESLSDGLGRVIMDDEHEEIRQRIRQVESGRSGDHLVAGIKGLGFGILGGATGIFKQVYDGAYTEGIQGVFSGLGKGLVGAVTKPVVGVLDLASETARAVRDSSRSRIIPERSRPPRCVLGPGGLLPQYSRTQSLGQQFLYSVNSRNYSEQLIAYESLRSNSEDLRVIVSSHWVRVVTNATTLTTVIESSLSDLQHCYPVTKRENSETRHYIELTIRVSGNNMGSYPYQEMIKKPRVRCDSAELATWVSQQLNYAKRMYNERLHTLTSDNIRSLED